MAEVDLSFPDLRIAIEVDGSVHLLDEVHARDLTRQNDLVLLGWQVLRFPNDRVLDQPAAVVAAVRRAVDAARAAALRPSA